MCIKPLMDEESHDRHRKRSEPDAHNHLQPIPQPFMIQGGMGDGAAGNFVLPAALLAQYPEFKALQWDRISPSNNAADDLSDTGGGGRSSYDASSGGEFGFDDDGDLSEYASGGGGNMYHDGYNGNEQPLLSVETVNIGNQTFMDSDWRG